MRIFRSFFFVFLLITVIGTACASRPDVPRDAIRERADKAFDDISDEEGSGKSSLRPSEPTPPRPSKPSPEQNNPKLEVQKGKRPAWIDQPNTQFPISQYLTGVGYGPARKSAEGNAHAEIAKIFSSTIDSRTRTYQGYIQTDVQGKSSTEQTLSMEEITEVSTQKVLSGVRIAAVYEEEGSEPIFYALAVLEREQSAKILEDKIRELDRGIQRLIDKAEGSSDNLSKIKYLKQAIQQFVLREAHDSEFRIVNLAGQGIPSPIYFSDIKNQLESILFRGFFVGVSVSGDRSKDIRDALVEGLNQEGFAVSDDLSRANVLIKGNVAIKPLDKGTPEWKYVEWRTHFELVDKKGGEAVFGSINKNGRQGHITLQQAENRAVGTIRKALTEEIARDVRQYIFFQ
ncbi:MAG: LPP20 family lipoprotein [Deltaproteobacteria bacterium]|nr:LPP20 family lipoprotein [Deltaproteobacteria bacterium]